MILITVITVCLCAAIAGAIWHDSKKLRAEDTRLGAELASAKNEAALLRSRLETVEKGVQAIGSRLAALSTPPPLAPMQRFDPQAAQRAQDQARRQKHKR